MKMVKDWIYMKSAFEKDISDSLLIVEAKPLKPRIAKNITTFQRKLIRRRIYVTSSTKCEVYD